MAKKAKKKSFRAASAVKAAARKVIGSPRPTRQVTPKPKKSQEKHRPTMGEWLSRED